ncbi:hypothetical protein HC031_31835 [Planosporangium thailandense]|uniref:Uncharacterized protein n=1 Tax=Planosporangium thailandense TaxID=765197 RepID=A0ABX0Y811_9ACTN|nr:hypothetical protein [Planosporangium thailandense]NJC74272.1 hypothetical protein [Planosporangium thailandense]
MTRGWLGFLFPTTVLTLLFNTGYAFSRHPDKFSAEAPWWAYMWAVIRTLAIAGIGGLGSHRSNLLAYEAAHPTDPIQDHHRRLLG